MPQKIDANTIANDQNKNQIANTVLTKKDQLEKITSNQSNRKKIGYTFLKYSGLTITFVSIAAILIIIGMIIYYRYPQPIKANAGFWLILTGVILTIATVILGFEKIN